MPFVKNVNSLFFSRSLWVEWTWITDSVGCKSCNALGSFQTSPSAQSNISNLRPAFSTSAMSCKDHMTWSSQPSSGCSQSWSCCNSTIRTGN
uniref:Uncharacterized protein n=1 Tax=Physcomitrium patens TaxID=3218 RepID=A0A2K1JV73_PHYPA|nr:hypothetical protein PHYPA_015193 [Physcomitrium patens]